MPSQFAINRKATTDYLDSQGWKYDTVMDEPSLSLFMTNFEIKSKLSSIRELIIVSSTDIQCLGLPDVKAGEDVRLTVCEYLTRANFYLKVGKFQLDFNDGEVRFQSTLVCSDSFPSRKDVKNVIDCPVVMFTRYGDGLMKCIFGFPDLETAIADIEY